MFAEITAAVQSTKVLTEMIKAAKELKNYNDFVTAIYDVNSKLMDASTVALASQEAQSQLIEKTAKLEAELRAIRNWEAEASRYALCTLAPEQYAYTLRPEAAKGEPAHFLCANCMNKQEKSLLQLFANDEFGKRYTCHNCKTEISIDSGYRPRVEQNYSPFNNI